MTDSASDTLDTEHEVSNQQLVRAARSFEAILISQIQIQDKLGDGLKANTRVGMIVLGLIAVSILILLFTLSSQMQSDFRGCTRYEYQFQYGYPADGSDEHFHRFHGSAGGVAGTHGQTDGSNE